MVDEDRLVIQGKYYDFRIKADGVDIARVRAKGKAWFIYMATPLRTTPLVAETREKAIQCALEQAAQICAKAAFGA